MIIRQAKTPSSNKGKPTWTKVKCKLKDMSSQDLIHLIQELYSLSKDCKSFLNTRFCTSSSSLEEAKAIISRSVNPDFGKHGGNITFVDAKKAISNYAHASDNLIDIVELRVYMCEQCAACARSYGIDYEGYYTSWANAFKAALIDIKRLSADLQPPFVDRMMEVYQQTSRYGYGMGEMAEAYLDEYGFFDE